MYEIPINVETNAAEFVGEMQAAERAVSQLGDTSENAASQVTNSIINMANSQRQVNEGYQQQEGILERLRRKIGELKAEADKSNSVQSIARINKELQVYEAELLRVGQAGKAGFDTAGNAIERTDGILQKLQRTAALYQKGMLEATRPENIEKYRIKLTEVQLQMAELTRGTQAAGSGRSFNGLQNSINQLSRELPAFTVSAQTGFLAISNNIPTLADAITRLKKANAELTASGQSGKPVWKQLVSSLFSWNTALSVGITLLTVYGKDIVNFFTKMFTGSQVINQTKQNFTALNEVMKEANKKAGDEIGTLKALYLVSTDTTRSIKDRTAAALELKNLYPSIFANQKTEAILTGRTADQYKELARAIEKAARSEAATARIKTNSTKELDILVAEDEINKKRQERLDEIKKRGDVVYNTQGSSLGVGGQTRKITVSESIRVANKEFDQEIAELEAKRASITKENEFVSKYIAAGNERLSGLIEKKRQALSVAQKSLEKATSPAQQETVRNNIATLQSELDAMLGKQSPQNKIADRLEKAADHIEENRKRVEGKLAELNAKYARKALSSDEEELQAVRDQYAEVRKIIEAENKEIEKYNKKNKTKKPLIDLKSADTGEKGAIEYVQAKQASTAFKKQLDLEADMYAAYEALKTKTTATEADKRFANDLKGFKNFGERLTAEIKKIQDIPEAQRTGQQKDDLSYLLDRKTKYDTDKGKAAQDKFADAYNAIASNEEKKNALLEKYRKINEDLATISDEKVRTSKINAAKISLQGELESLKEENFQKTELFAQFNSEVLNLTMTGLKERIAAIESALANGVNFPEGLKKQLETELKLAKSVLGKTDYQTETKQAEKKRDLSKEVQQSTVASSAAQAEATKSAGEMNAKLKQLPREKAMQLAGDLAQIGGDMQGLGASISQFDEGLGDTVSTAGQLLGVVADLAGAIASKDPAKIIGAVIKSVTTVLNISAAARESERKAAAELKKFNDEVIAGELTYQATLRERERQIIRNNKLTKEGLKDEKALLEQQKSAIDQQYATVLKRLQAEQQIVGKETYKYGGFLGFGKKTGTRDVLGSLAGKSFSDLEQLYAQGKLTEGAKALFEQLRKLKEEGADVAKTLEDIADEAAQIDTATTASDITDAIVEGFKNGKRGAAAFADDFESMMQDAMLNAFKYDIVEAQVKEFYKEFAAASKDGLSAEDVEKLNKKYKDMIDIQTQQFEELEKVTGLAPKNINQGNGISGAIKGITEAQADLLAGQFGGLRLTQVETNEILRRAEATNTHALSAIKEQAQHLQAISENTANTVVALNQCLPHLKKISENTQSNQRAGGL